jgi:transposase
MHRHELNDHQWKRIEPLIHRHGRQSKLGDRSFVNAVVYVLKTGAPWRDLPERFGHWKTVYNRFANWSKAGRFEAIFKALQMASDDTASLVDGTISRAHQDAAGGKGGSNSISWVVHVADFPPKSTQSSMPKDARFTLS